MLTRRGLLSAGAAALLAAPAGAQEAGWPSRPLRIIIPTAPGGSPDIAARLLGDKITPRIGHPVERLSCPRSLKRTLRRRVAKMIRRATMFLSSITWPWRRFIAGAKRQKPNRRCQGGRW